MKRYSLLLGALLTAASAFAWSQKGHDAIAYIAEKHLTEATADSVASILDGKSPVYWANRLDNASHTPD
ncbi:MAG: S1/P1 nuclease, partial [Muribaculaceae bacterium]|nr:S1/P1 nuclease [Muribaculaceae bacterium]